MEKRQRSVSAIEKQGALTEHQMERRARVLGIPAWVTPSRGDRRMGFSNRDLNAAINIRRCAELMKRPAELTQVNVLGQPRSLEVSKEKLRPIAGGWSKSSGRRQRMGI